MKDIFLRYVLWLLLLFSHVVQAQQMVFRGLSVTEGLSDLVVNALYKDSAGYVWIGTGTSLERFDGIHLKRYSVPGNNEKLKRVNAIAETSDNRLWMGNGMGLWCLNHEQQRLEQVAAETLKYGVRALLPDEHGTLYIGSESGLFIYRDGLLERVLPDAHSFAAANTVTGLAWGDDGILWLSTLDGLYAFCPEDRSLQSFRFMQGNQSFSAYMNLACIGSSVYLGTMEHGIIRFDIPTQTFYPYVDVGCNVISALSGDGKEMLYVGTDGNGVHFISTEDNRIVRSFQHAADREGPLRSNSIYALLVDRDGLVWVGLYQLGLDYTLFQSGLFHTYGFPPYFDTKGMPIRSIAFNGNEKLIGSRDGLFFIDESQSRYATFTTPQLRSNMIISTYVWKGNFYIGTYGGGMYVLDPVTLSLTDFAPDIVLPFLKGQIFSITSDRDNTLWIGTSSGLFRYKDGVMLNHYTSSNSKLPDGNVYHIFFDSDGKGWICTENGLCLWDPVAATLRTDIFPEGFAFQEKYREVYEDSGKQLYFLPDKGPIYISDLSMSRFRYLQSDHLLAGKDCMFMIEDDEGWLWIGTSNGLYRYDKEDTFTFYHFADGIPSPVFILCLPVKDESGRIWMGNTKGLIYADLHDRKRVEGLRMPLAITDVFVDGKSCMPAAHQKGESCLRLDAPKSSLTICFSDFSFTDPNYMAYEYRLDGMEEEWQVLSGHSEATFYGLSPGNYCFRVRRIGDAGSETSIRIHVPYFQVTWLMAGGVCVLLLLGVLLFVLRKRKAAVKITEQQETLDKEQSGSPIPEEKYKSNRISVDECRRLAERLEKLMQTDRLYTNPELKISDLASRLGTSAHTLSYLFNQHLKLSYYDYVNRYRIDEFKRLVNREEYARYTLSALADLCGFSSRASFFRYFKKVTGITPNEYVHSIGKENE